MSKPLFFRGDFNYLLVTRKEAHNKEFNTILKEVLKWIKKKSKN